METTASGEEAEPTGPTQPTPRQSRLRPQRHPHRPLLPPLQSQGRHQTTDSGIEKINLLKLQKMSRFHIFIRSESWVDHS